MGKMPTASAANIPPELFPIILDYIGTDERGDGSLSERRIRGLRDWQACSLVCLYWANYCRRYIFYYLINNLRSQEALEALRRMVATEGSQRLKSVHALVARPTLRIWQTWEARSWIHHIHPPPLKGTTSHLTLCGPIPSNLPVAAFRSPHWSLPRTMPSQFTPFSDCRIKDIHFPSFRDLVLLVKHFKKASSFAFENLTWASTEGDAILPTRSFPKSPDSFDGEYKWAFGIEASRCTENMVILLQTCLLYPDFPLFHNPETNTILNFLRAFYGTCAAISQGREHGLTCTMEWHLEDKEVNFSIFEDAGLIGIAKCTLTPVPPLASWNLNGFLLGIWKNEGTSLETLSSKFPVAAFVNLFASIPSLRFMVLSFGDTETMDHMTRSHPELLCSPPSANQTYRLAVRSASQILQATERNGLAEISDSSLPTRASPPEEEWSGCDESDDDAREVWQILDHEKKPTGESFESLDEVLSALSAVTWVEEMNNKRG